MAADPLLAKARRTLMHMRDRARRDVLAHSIGPAISSSWLGTHGFSRFLEHVGLPPSLEHSIDRKDNELGYVPGNVRWASLHEQLRNKRVNHWVEFAGETKVLQDWAREFGIHSATLHRRLENGWPFALALSLPVRGRRDTRRVARSESR